MVGGRESGLGDYSRFDNPFAHAAHGDRVVKIGRDGETLEIDLGWARESLALRQPASRSVR